MAILVIMGTGRPARGSGGQSPSRTQKTLHHVLGGGGTPLSIDHINKLYNTAAPAGWGRSDPTPLELDRLIDTNNELYNGALRCRAVTPSPPPGLPFRNYSLLGRTSCQTRP